MSTDHQPLFSSSFLRAHWEHDFSAYLEEGDATVLEALRHWSDKEFQKETSAEATFIDVFFKGLWGQSASGQRSRAEGYTIYPQYPVPGAGQGGGTGEADLAAGWFDVEGVPPIPQLLCEFKDVRSGLDLPQNRKGNNRSPVKQCFDYLRHASKTLYGHEPVQPTWGLVTDMNEFRFYHYNTGPSQYQRFVIRGATTLGERSLLEDSAEGAFQRFLFVRFGHRDSLLTRGGPSTLAGLLNNQWVQEKALEKGFYEDYHAYREAVFEAIVEANPDFDGTRGKLVRLTQRFLDRCIFILYCEDMGETLKYPPNLLRDLLVELSTDRFYSPDDDAAWTRVKALFVSMRDGTPFGENTINRFNGGLFEDNPDLDNLRIPTQVFCSRNQTTTKELNDHPQTLLYFSATYNFGMEDGSGQKTIDLYTLGRIFEQSITDLEKMEAAADDRVSLMKLSKRKSDGVYYTPEWVTHYIVQETVGARINDYKAEHRLIPTPEFDDRLIGRYSNWKRSKRTKGREGPTIAEIKPLYAYEQALLAFQADLERLKVVDPACGSGAFLIQAFDRLMEERRWVSAQLAALEGQAALLFDSEANMRSILANNIYGVDINPESVEITRLALWLRTALPDRPLTSLDNNIRDGNSLIGPDFYRSEQGQFEFSADERERINTFDWTEAFPEVFERGGFDCVIGNPPYVKLQHFRKYQPQVSEYLSGATRGQRPLYASTQTGNFDMYLPFIEKGIELLNDQGRMGYIAPNVWPLNAYGKGLRNWLRANRRLERWVDFKSHQVFDEATIYTSLQFYRGGPVEAVRCVFAPNGEEDVSTVEWETVADDIPYDELPEDDAWAMVSTRDRAVIERLRADHQTLADAADGIFVGVQTSANEVYHLQWSDNGSFVSSSPDCESDGWRIEPDVMLPLISGEESKRYITPETSVYVLFPYDVSGPSPQLISAERFASEYPNAWAYLRANEERLRKRESRKMDIDDGWWGYNYPKNLDKQHLPKLVVAQTVPELRVTHDPDGTFCLDNVRANGILAANDTERWFFLGVLNSHVLNYVFKRIAKPKDNNFFEANKQFIAPLPIPVTDAHQQEAIATIAQRLQQLHSQTRDLNEQLATRLASQQTTASSKTVDWVWADVFDVEHWKEQNPENLSGRSLTKWAKSRVQTLTDAHLQLIDSRLIPGAQLSVRVANGELSIYAGQDVLLTVYPDDAELSLIAAQWRLTCRSTTVTDALTAKKLVAQLLELRTTSQQGLSTQITRLDEQIVGLEDEISAGEAEVNELVCLAFQLTDQERAIIAEAEPSHAAF